MLVGGLLVRLLMWNALVAVIAGAYAGVALSPRRGLRAGRCGAGCRSSWSALAFVGIALVALIPVGLAYVAIIAAVVGAELALKLQVVAIVAGIVLGLAFVAFAAVGRRPGG